MSSLAEYIFDIPVYLWSEARFDRESEAAFEQYVTNHIEQQQPLMRALGGEDASAFDPKKNDLSERLRPGFIKDYGGPWQFNQVIGWLRLFAGGSEINGHWYMAEGERLTRKSRKRFYLVSPSNALFVNARDEGVSSDEIYKRLLESLGREAESMKPQHLDISCLERVGPYVDWRKLVDLPASW